MIFSWVINIRHLCKEWKNKDFITVPCCHGLISNRNAETETELCKHKCEMHIRSAFGLISIRSLSKFRPVHLDHGMLLPTYGIQKTHLFSKWHIMYFTIKEQHHMFYNVWRSPWKTLWCSKVLLQKNPHSIFLPLVRLSPAFMLPDENWILHGHLDMTKKVKRCGQSQYYCHHVLCFHRV